MTLATFLNLPIPLLPTLQISDRMKFKTKPLLPKIKARQSLPWSQLSHRKFRLTVALMGVAFSNILIFTQLGLRALLFDGIKLVPELLDGDLFLVSAYSATIDGSSIPKIYLNRTKALPEVTEVVPLYIREANWVDPAELNSQQSSQQANNTQAQVQAELFPNTVKILAFNPIHPVFKSSEINRQLNRVKTTDTILFDRLSQEKLGEIAKLYTQQGRVTAIMNNRRIEVVGLFSLGSTLFDNGHVVMSDWNYARRNGQSSINNFSVGVITLKSGIDPQTAQTRIRANLPPAVKVMTREEMIAAEQAYRASLPNGKVLNFGAAMGFVIGTVIVYQILYTDVSDRLNEYATLKAIGYSDISLLFVVLQQALLLGILGFLPGILSSYGVYILLTELTKIPLAMRPDIIIHVFCLTLIMCGFAGGMATNKLRSADPADIF
ncbi:MAG: ABC transporter permease DevC [Cyanobacteria bacterium P01_G01_bin.67]